MAAALSVSGVGRVGALPSHAGVRRSADASPIVVPLSNVGGRHRRHLQLAVRASKSSPKLPPGRRLRVAVVGGGPAGAAAAETLARGGVETVLIERKLDNCKPCGGLIPLCMLGEFDLPLDIIHRRLTKVKMISPSNIPVDVCRTLKPHEYLGLVRREVFDAYLRERAEKNGATVIKGLFLSLDEPSGPGQPYVLHYTEYGGGGAGAAGAPSTLEVDAVIGADGANSRVAKAIDAGDYERVLSFNELVKLPEEKMEYYEDLGEFYLGADVSSDYWAWVFPKCDHVIVGSATVNDKRGLKRFEAATRLRAGDKIDGGRTIGFEAHPIPQHPRPRRVSDRVTLVGDAAGYATKLISEGIYYAATSGRMCAEAIVEGSEGGTRMVDESDLRRYLDRYDRAYRPTFKLFDVMQTVFLRSNAAREALVEMCADDYVQRMSCNGFLDKRVKPPVSPLEYVRLAVKTIGSLIRANALREEMNNLAG